MCGITGIINFENLTKQNIKTAKIASKLLSLGSKARVVCTSIILSLNWLLLISLLNF